MEEGAAPYRREGELEVDRTVRKERDNGTDPDGMSEDEFMCINKDDKETQTGNLSLDKAVLSWYF